MKCEEFKNNLVELCDKNIDSQLAAEYMQHIEQCAECRSYYNDYMSTVNMLRPRHMPASIQAENPKSKEQEFSTGFEPGKKVSKRQQFQRRFMRMAAMLAIFIAGVVTGLSNLFLTDAKATVQPSLILEQAIKNVHNVGNFVIDLNARTAQNENMAFFDPDADFVKMSLKVIHQNDSTFWRLEKEGGRTIVFNGREQYMWTNNGTKIRGSANAGFMEDFAYLLHPEKLLEKEREIIDSKQQESANITETDSTTIVTIYTEVFDKNINLLIEKSGLKKHKCIIENVFTKNDGLLRKIQIWIEREGKKTLIINSSDIKYNVPLNKEELIQLPDIKDSEWLEAQEPQLEENNRLHTLQNETATEAAKRIATALISGNTKQAEEALYYYSQMLPQLTKSLKDCKMSDFSEPKKKDDYAGVFVFYKLTDANGKSQTRHMALRRDNDQKIWMLDGGF